MPGLSGHWDLPEDPLAALRDGRTAPFEGFVRAVAPVFLGFFLKLGADRQEAEDMTQEVFLKLHHHAPRYRAEERFPAFCFRIARNVWIDHRRRRAARPAALSLDGGDEADRGGRLVDGLSDGATSSETSLERREEAERLLRALAELPDRHRLVFELGVLQDLAYAEIAAMLGIPTGTVKSRMFHAVRKLRAALEEAE